MEVDTTVFEIQDSEESIGRGDGVHERDQRQEDKVIQHDSIREVCPRQSGEQAFIHKALFKCKASTYPSTRLQEFNVRAESRNQMEARCVDEMRTARDTDCQHMCILTLLLLEEDHSLEF